MMTHRQLAYYTRLCQFTLVFAFSVVVLGALTRLKDAGLGCPDWPGCYGQLLVPSGEQAALQANMAFPERPLEVEKAWYEMIHRYLAGVLGLLIFVIAGLSRRLPQPQKQKLGWIPIGLALLVVFQAILGMWTVTLGLFPTVVMGHLLGGFFTFSLLVLINIRLKYHTTPWLQQLPTGIKTVLAIATACVCLQVALGGWTAANYAAAICTELPICNAGWQQHIDLPKAFQLWGHDRELYEYAPHLTPDIKITIHVMHRFGAIVTALSLILACVLLMRQPSRPSKYLSGYIAGLTLIQMGLGIGNVVWHVPLTIAVAHNLVGCFLFATMINVLLASLPFRATQQSHPHVLLEEPTIA